jgi:hypothetical protein
MGLCCKSEFFALGQGGMTNAAFRRQVMAIEKARK